MTTNQARSGTLYAIRHKAVQAVHSPLGFFALALLIVEGFLFGAGAWFDLDPTMRIGAMAVGVVLFLVVFGTVVALVVKYPKNLVFSEESHLQYEGMQIFGTEENAMTGQMLTALEVEVAPPLPVSQLPETGDASTD